jgi:hypothetical protein
MALPVKPFWPTLTQTIHTMCVYIQRHQQTLISVVDAIDPSAHADVVAAFAALTAACTLFISVMNHVDPNWKPK